MADPFSDTTTPHDTGTPGFVLLQQLAQRLELPAPQLAKPMAAMVHAMLIILDRLETLEEAGDKPAA